jgi:hypothetical protein
MSLYKILVGALFVSVIVLFVVANYNANYNHSLQTHCWW